MFNVNKVLLHDLCQFVLIYDREMEFLKSCLFFFQTVKVSSLAWGTVAQETSGDWFTVISLVAAIFPAFVSNAAITLRSWQ